jgi:hypothetical protein
VTSRHSMSVCLPTFIGKKEFDLKRGQIYILVEISVVPNHNIDYIDKM